MSITGVGSYNGLIAEQPVRAAPVVLARSYAPAGWARVMPNPHDNARRHGAVAGSATWSSWDRKRSAS